MKNCAVQCEFSVFGEGQISQAEHYSRNTLPLLIFVCALFMAQGADAQFKVVDSGPPQAVFSGEDRVIRVLIENPTEQKLEMNVSRRLHQASSATSMPVGPAKRWKTISLLPHQVSLETYRLALPAVRVGTHFYLEWLTDEGQVFGRTDLVGYPEDLLQGLGNRVGKTPIGILDPGKHLSPLLRKLKLDLQDLDANAGLDSFAGKLAIVGPILSKSERPERLSKRVTDKAKQPMVIIWIQPPEPGQPEPFPPVYWLSGGQGKIVVLRSSIMRKLADAPEAQLQLLRCAEIGLHPEVLQLPETQP